MYWKEVVSSTSEKLGVSIKTLYAWQRQERLDRGAIEIDRREEVTIEEELRQLKRKITELR